MGFAGFPWRRAFEIHGLGIAGSLHPEAPRPQSLNPNPSRAQGSVLRAQCSGLRVQGSGFRGFRV